MSTVYFLRDPATGRVKIGCTEYLHNRVTALSKLVGHPLQLAAAIPGDRQCEQGFHALLIDLHVGGEWFQPHARLDAVIIGASEGWINLAALRTKSSAIRSEIALKAWAVRRGSPHQQSAQRPAA